MRPKLSREAAEQAAHSARLTQHLYDIGKQNISLAGFLLENHRLSQLAEQPEVTLFDCRQT